MKSIDTAELMATAVHAAREAGALQRQSFANSVPAVFDSTAHDLKIETDRASENIICEIIHNRYPQHAIISEEGGLTAGDAPYTWIVDPLDGTVNYYFNLPFFCTCIACYYTPQGTDGNHSPCDAAVRCWQYGEVLVGVVFAPFFDWMFSAASGWGATCNGKGMQRGGEIKLQDAVVGISFGSQEIVIRQMERVASTLLRSTKKIRMLGATGLDLVHVAKGSLSALVQLNVNIWDYAAAYLILSECGMQFEARLNQLNGWQILAAPPKLFGQLRTIVDASVEPGFLLSE